MTPPRPPAPPPLSRVQTFLADLHPAGFSDFEPLPGGFWSSAYSYRTDEGELVLRLGTVPEGFDADVAAQRHRRPGLPIPRVFEVGQAFDGFTYAVSERCHGRFLESVTPEEAAIAGPTLVELLSALRSVPDDDPPDPDGWRAWIRAGLVDDPTARVGGWRKILAAEPRLERVFRACEDRIDSLVDAVPERRDLIHGDLLHRNVLIADDASSVTAVFSWKCATRGDFLFDVAWCTFWGRWHPGIGAIDLRRRVVGTAAADDPAFVDAAVRHHCYELQIGASHMGWYAWTEDRPELERVTGALDEILERGPC